MLRPKVEAEDERLQTKENKLSRLFRRLQELYLRLGNLGQAGSSG